MLRTYRILYRVGFTPWEGMTKSLPIGEQISALFAHEEGGGEAPYGQALDLGCGSGIWAVKLAARGWQVTGVDFVPGGVVVEPGLRSQVEDRWRAAYQKAGKGALGALREADPELVAEDSERLGAALARVFDALPDGGRALVVGHSPTNEAAVFGLTGEIVPPLAKGAGVLVIALAGGYRVEPLG
jgi:SAM-dependent methyltransferase